MLENSAIDINQQTDIICFQWLDYACLVVSIYIIIIHIGIGKLKNSSAVISVCV